MRYERKWFKKKYNNANAASDSSKEKEDIFWFMYTKLAISARLSV